MFFLYLVPTKPPANIDANILDKFVAISWKPVPEESRNGKILGYRITYYQAGNQTYQQTKTIPHDFFSVKLESLGKFTEYHVKILAYTGAGNGKVDYISFNTSDDSKYQHRILHTVFHSVPIILFGRISFLKIGTNGLARRRKLKTWLYLRFRLARTCVHLR